MSKPIHADIRLNKYVFEPLDPIEVHIDFRDYYRDVENIKASLFVLIEVNS